MASTKVYLIRHAEAEGNLYRRAHGWYDSLITDNGYRQIAALAGRFAGERIDAAYSSGLFRTRATARAVCSPRGLAPRTAPDLREISLGAWEDKPWGLLEREDALNLRRFSHCAPDFRVRGGESFAQVQGRVARTVFRLAAPHPGQTIALFSHGTAIRCLLGAVRGLGPGELDGLGHSDNTAVSCLEVQGEQARVVFENDSSHLPEEISTLARQKWWKGQGGGDVNLWFRPMDLEAEPGRYLAARREAWRTIHGEAVPFDGDGFLADALRCWRQDPRRAVLWAMRGDEPAGILQLDLRREADRGVGYIPFLYVMPQLRCQGLGVQLLGQAVAAFRPLGRTRLRLRCAPDNDRAQRFYRKYGFVRAGQDEGARVPLDILEKYIGYDPRPGEWGGL